MVRFQCGGILGALHIFCKHEGAVKRDLLSAGYTLDDVWSEKFPLDHFAAFIAYSPPGSAVFHILNEGWDATAHKISDLIEWVKMLCCTHSEDPQRAYDSLEKERRPGQRKPVEPKHQMTIGDYMKLAGLEDPV